MANSTPAGSIELPKLPAPLERFIPYLAEHHNSATADLLQPYIEYEAKLREIYAQEPDRDIVKDQSINTVPIFAGYESDIRVRSRNIALETDAQKEKYLMPLKDSGRKSDGSAAMVGSFKDFQKNFNLFSESALVDLDWNNVVAAGSSVVTALLPVPEKHSESKRAQRSYYHDILAPASDCDLFIYGLDEKQGLAKLQQIETKIKDAILYETTTIRTKNAITIASQYPTRHVQIVLRLYHSISEILTGFDVDCSCVAYDGQQVYAAPRAVTAFMTQRNTVDLTRRSPSYENRLSKYSHRGFEVYWPQLERSRIDPTIFERSFGRTMGLARLLILEKLPKPTDRDAYLDQRRQERGRPPANRYHRNMRSLSGNIKEQQPDDVAEWVEEDEVSSYHTFTVPYGPKFHARKIEKLLYTKDLLLNSEWNKPKDRTVDLHRHPCFFGSVEDIIHDCCGYCPSPVTDEEHVVAEEESKIYITGDISFLKDDPGRQTIGSFHPINDQDWCEMAYVGNTARLCQAIVDCDLEVVQDWFSNEEAIENIDRRDYTGRTPLHLATMSSTPEITEFLINEGARLTARLVDGKTPLHIAAQRGNAAMVKALMDKSEANEEEEARKEDARKALRKKGAEAMKDDGSKENDSMSLDEQDNSDEAMSGTEDNDDSVTQGSFIKIQKPEEVGKNGDIPEEDELTPDIYDVNILAWDTPVSPLHLAIMNGHIGVIETLVSNFGADLLLPVKLLSDYDRSPQGAILTLALALQLPTAKAKDVTKTLLKLGASSAQADMDQTSAFHYTLASGNLEILDTLLEHDEPAARSVLNHIRVTGSSYYAQAESPLTTAISVRNKTLIQKILDLGADPSIKFQNFIRSYERKFVDDGFSRLFRDNPEKNMQTFQENIQQPIILTVDSDLPTVVKDLLEKGVDVNTMTTDGYVVSKEGHRSYRRRGETILDVVRCKLEGLRKYKGEENSDPPPRKLEGDEHYLKGLVKGSYKYWTAEKDLGLARNQYQKELEEYRRSSEDRKSKKGLKEKKEAIQELIVDLERAENALLGKGAKTFNKLHPKIESPKEEPARHHDRSKPEPFKIAFSFQISDLTDDTREGYLELFEAAWHGDIDKTKSLTLAHWGSSGANAPLRVAVKDKNDITPFAIAVWRGHKELAHTILNITQAQYQPEEPTGKHERYNARPAESDEELDEESDEDEVKVYSQLIDENFTMNLLENVGGAVKSKITPLEMFNWPTQMWRFGDANNRRGTLLRYAIQMDDIRLLKYLLELGLELSARNIGGQVSKTFTVTPSDFYYAVEHGRTAILAEIIMTTGAGIPLDELVEKSGAEVKEAPKYYQGLSIHGKKRADWAQAGRGDRGHRRNEKQYPPLLEAAHRGSIDSTEWFLSDAPIRMYKQFAATHQDDKRVETLSKTDEGFEETISKWLGARSDLALHCAVLASNDEHKNPVQLIEYLLQALPRSIERKSSDGWTPLHLAFHPRRIIAARTLIAAGADQLARDKMGRNIVHCALRPPNSSIALDPEELKRMLELVDKRVLQELFLQRAQENSSTPLAQWLADIDTLFYGRSNEQRQCRVATLRVILDFSGANDLDEFGGEGDMPLHVLVRKSIPELVKLVIEERPELLFRENATGRTAYEMAEDAYLHHRITNHPRIPNSNESRGRYFYGRNNEIQDKDPESFIKKDALSSDDETDVVATYRICYEAAKSSPRKRKLVSLSAANEIAHRLALRQRTNRDKSERMKEEDEEEKAFKDEVSKWVR